MIIYFFPPPLVKFGVSVVIVAHQGILHSESSFARGEKGTFDASPFFWDDEHNASVFFPFHMRLSIRPLLLISAMNVKSMC